MYPVCLAFQLEVVWSDCDLLLFSLPEDYVILCAYGKLSQWENLPRGTDMDAALRYDLFVDVQIFQDFADDYYDLFGCCFFI